MEPTKTEILITRIVDDEASAKDWADFERLAVLEPDVWVRLARQQRDAASLRRAVASATGIAEAVDLPIESAGPGAERVFARRFNPWIGWAMAAAVALAWLGVNRISLLDTAPQRDGAVTGNYAGVTLSPASADEALDQYKALGEQEGRYIGELPKVMIEARTMPDGVRIEVLYLRQILEREVVNGMYRFGEDDQGRAMPIPIEPTYIQASDPL